MFAILAVLAAVIILLVRSRRTRQPIPQETVNAEPPTWRWRALTPIQPTGIVPKDGEHFYWSGSADLLGEKHWSEYQGGYSGVSFRVAKGLYVRSGGTRGHSVPHSAVAIVDVGTLFISDRRAVFVGGTTTNEIPVSKIANVEAFSDGLKFDISNKKPQTYTTHSEEAAIIMQRVMAGQLEDRKALYESVVSAKAEVSDLLKRAKAGEITDAQVQDALARIRETLPPGTI